MLAPQTQTILDRYRKCVLGKSALSDMIVSEFSILCSAMERGYETKKEAIESIKQVLKDVQNNAQTDDHTLVSKIVGVLKLLDDGTIMEAIEAVWESNRNQTKRS